MSQYTIRNVPEALDRNLREWAERSGESLNMIRLSTAAIAILTHFRS